MSEKQKIQFNILILPEWKEALERVARIKSYHMDQSLTVTDIVREALWNLISGSLNSKSEE